jgi:hypothetical protein
MRKMMTTKHSPISAIKRQADKIAFMLKAFERGEKIDDRFAEKIREARIKRGVLKFAIAMDGKTLIIDMPFDMIGRSSEVAISEWIVKAMKELRSQ